MNAEVFDMIDNENRFPEKFLWGGAISSSQSEGNANREPSIYDFMPVGNKRTEWFLNGKYNSEEAFYPNREGIHFYQTYKEDIQLFAKMGFKAFRISIAWSRIYPNGEEEIPNPEGLAFYEDVIDELLKYNIEPIITILHYDLPIHLVEKYNGFESRKVVDLYVKFASTLFEHFASKVKYWMTINEINIVKYCPLDAGVKILRKNKEEQIFQISHHLFLASAKAVIEYKKHHYDGKIGMMLGYEPIYPYTCLPEDVLMSEIRENEILFYSDVQILGYYPQYMLNYFKEKKINIKKSNDDDEILKQGKVDYIAISYYSSATCSSDSSISQKRGNITYSVKNPYLKETEWGWQLDPIGLRTSLIRLENRYHLPILIAECGLGIKEEFKQEMIEDDYRIEFFDSHLKEVKKALNYGVNVMGFLAWSPIDMPSAATGEIEKRYGFIYVDANNQGMGSYKRYKKKSFDWFKNVIETNGKNI